MSEKTLASGKQRLTLAGNMVTGIAPMEIDVETAQFWIDNPEALKMRLGSLAYRPTIVQVIEFKDLKCHRLPDPISELWGIYDIFVIDNTCIANERILEGIKIHPDTGLIIMSEPIVHSVVLKKFIERERRTGTFPSTEILFICSDDHDTPMGLSRISTCDSRNAVRWVGEWLAQKMAKKIQTRIAKCPPC